MTISQLPTIDPCLFGNAMGAIAILTKHVWGDLDCQHSACAYPRDETSLYDRITGCLSLLYLFTSMNAHRSLLE